MAENTDYRQALSVALKARADWLEKSELGKLKDELRLYHTGFASLYNLYLKKGLINEDPYKQEAKIGELEVPDTSSFTDATRLDQLSMRLSTYDNQLDFLVNFYQFSADFLTLDRIKRIVGLVKYIDWVHLTPDSQSANTMAVAEMTNQIKTGAEPLTMSVISESLAHLNRSYTPIMGYLKSLTDYQRELYKLELRNSITSEMGPADAAQVPPIKRKWAQINPGKPFYPDLAEEVIKEDTTKEGPALRERILKSLAVAEVKPKAAKPQVSFKSILLEGVQLIGTTAQAFQDVAGKMDENHILLENKKQSFWQKVKKAMAQMLNKEPDPVIYEVEYIDPVRGVPVRDKINFVSFRTDLDKKVRTLSTISVRGTGLAKLEAMQEEQIISFLEKNIREIQSLHKILAALDEFFKAATDRADREKVKGIKPELATIKNAIIRANAKRHEYSAQKEEEEQLKRLGVNPSAQGA
ncbi:hypothetical protein [Leadbettera azotonutricia]|uniref:Uncharacterized protein n=1 Tax=Leadbettera azotonutricia (strain ATCC BAA-888 / DSM 13862 / ZAS-9) TaxID=545695 RepID=F5Y9R0_LEAAZ|nr:hypothetical protein [Leadbettera azotonutricia]AEF81619.1 conserved hypothetical protein [Leadbettera azotonutricia ZAS-9]